MGDKRIIGGDFIDAKVRLCRHRLVVVSLLFIFCVVALLGCFMAINTWRGDRTRSSVHTEMWFDTQHPSGCWSAVSGRGENEENKGDVRLGVGISVLPGVMTSSVLVIVSVSDGAEPLWNALSPDCRLQLLRSTAGEVAEEYTDGLDAALSRTASETYRLGPNPSTEVRGGETVRHFPVWFTAAFVGAVVWLFTGALVTAVVWVCRFIGLVKWRRLQIWKTHCPLCKYELMEGDHGKRHCPECGFWGRVREG